MTALSLRTRLLRGRLALARFGWTNLLAGALFLSGIAACALLPELESRRTGRESDLVDLQARLRREARQMSASTTAPPSNLQAFRAALGDIREAELAVRTMFAEADKQLLELDQADYKLSYDKAGGFYAYSVQMPVRGSYLALRIFCEQVLLALPYASLDDIGFKRRATGETDLDVKLHFTLYLAGPPDYAAGIAATAGREGGR
jgi:hypothetical protein